MIDKTRCDAELGQKIFHHLKNKGYLTMETGKFDDYDTRVAKLKQHVSEMLQIMGLDVEDPQLKETPKRYAKVWVEDSMYGLDWNLFPKCTVFKQGGLTPNSMVISKNNPISAVCAHHIERFYGLQGNGKHFDFGPGCTIAYIPKNDRIIGISKLSRITEFASARPCNAEELTQIIQEILKYVLQTEDVAVYMETFHNCQVLRGAKANASTVTLACSGIFESDPQIRAEFLNEARTR